MSVSVSTEARQRIDEAQIRDAAFFLRRNTGEEALTREDAESLIRILFRAKNEGIQISPTYVMNELQKIGRSRDKSKILAEILFK